MMAITSEPRYDAAVIVATTAEVKAAGDWEMRRTCHGLLFCFDVLYLTLAREPISVLLPIYLLLLIPMYVQSNGR